MIRMGTPPGRRIAAAGLAVAVGAGGVMAGEHHVVHAQGNEAQLFFRVLDGTGAPVTDLQPEDFIIEEGGVRCSVARVELINEPLRLAIFLDDSVGAIDYLRELRAALPQFVDGLPETGQVALIRLASRARTVVDYTDGPERLRERIEEFFVQRNDASRFFDGLVEAIDDLVGEARWPVIAIITADGPEGSNYSERRANDLFRKIGERRVAVHSLGLQTPRGRGFQTGYAASLSEATGGWHDALSTPSALVTDKLTEMAAEISRRQAEASNQDLVVFERPDVAEGSRLSVAVKRAEVTLSVSLDGRPR